MYSQFWIWVVEERNKFWDHVIKWTDAINILVQVARRVFTYLSQRIERALKMMTESVQKRAGGILKISLYTTYFNKVSVSAVQFFHQDLENLWPVVNLSARNNSSNNQTNSLTNAGIGFTDMLNTALLYVFHDRGRNGVEIGADVVFEVQASKSASISILLWHLSKNVDEV